MKKFSWFMVMIFICVKAQASLSGLANEHSFIFHHKEKGTLINVLTVDISKFQKENESYAACLARVVNSLIDAHKTHVLHIINVQEIPGDKEHAILFSVLCQKNLPDFVAHTQGNSMMLINGTDMTLSYSEVNVREPFSHMSIKLDRIDSKMMAIYFFNLKLIMVNTHGVLLNSEDRSDEFNKVISYLSGRYSGKRIQFFGEFNGAHKDNVGGIFDIETFASTLRLVDMKLYKSDYVIDGILMSQPKL